MGQTGSFAKVIEPLTFLLVQHYMNIYISFPQSFTSDLIRFVMKSHKHRRRQTPALRHMGIRATALTSGVCGYKGDACKDNGRAVLSFVS
jgi:hypothetical protein